MTLWLERLVCVWTAVLAMPTYAHSDRDRCYKTWDKDRILIHITRGCYCRSTLASPGWGRAGSTGYLIPPGPRPGPRPGPGRGTWTRDLGEGRGGPGPGPVGLWTFSLLWRRLSAEGQRDQRVLSSTYCTGQRSRRASSNIKQATLPCTQDSAAGRPLTNNPCPRLSAILHQEINLPRATLCLSASASTPPRSTTTLHCPLSTVHRPPARQPASPPARLLLAAGPCPLAPGLWQSREPIFCFARPPCPRTIPVWSPIGRPRPTTVERNCGHAASRSSIGGFRSNQAPLSPREGGGGQEVHRASMGSMGAMGKKRYHVYYVHHTLRTRPSWGP